MLRVVALAIAASGFFFVSNTQTSQKADALSSALTMEYGLDDTGYSNFIVVPQTFLHGDLLEQ